MGFIPQITCRHCGKKYSALHSRCPYCKTRHVKQTSRTTPTTASARPGSAAAKRTAANTRWQFIFGCVLIVAVIVAVIVLISASLGPKETAQTTPTPPPEPTIAVTSVTITFINQPVGESFTQRVEWDPIQLGANVYPVEALEQAKVTWRSSNKDVCTVDETGLVTAIASGKCEIICECGGVAAHVGMVQLGQTVIFALDLGQGAQLCKILHRGMPPSIE